MSCNPPVPTFPDFLVEMFGVTAHNIQRIAPDGSRVDRQAGAGAETTGTPYSDRYGEGQLVPRTISKHHAALMKMDNAAAWLGYMMEAIAEVFPADAKAQRSLGLYFGHFLAFFEFEPRERERLCELCQRVAVPPEQPQPRL